MSCPNMSKSFSVKPSNFVRRNVSASKYAILRVQKVPEKAFRERRRFRELSGEGDERFSCPKFASVSRNKKTFSRDLRVTFWARTVFSTFEKCSPVALARLFSFGKESMLWVVTTTNSCLRPFPSLRNPSFGFSPYLKVAAISKTLQYIYVDKSINVR